LVAPVAVRTAFFATAVAVRTTFCAGETTLAGAVLVWVVFFAAATTASCMLVNRRLPVLSPLTGTGVRSPA
jgi:hypothetical protein